MENFRGTETATAPINEFEEDRSDIESAERRLKLLAELNSELEKGDSSDWLGDSNGRYLPYEKAFAWFGASLGILPPAAIFLKAALASAPGELGIFLLLTALVTSASAATGFFTGKLVGRIVKELSQFSWPIFLLSLPFVGVTWGILSGGVGGAFVLLIGAIPGAAIGAAVGMVALPAFALLHSALKDGELIEKKNLYPAMFAVSGLIAALILGFPAV